jgi:hypothetical protein
MKFILLLLLVIPFSFIPYIQSDSDAYSNSISESDILNNQNTESVEFSCKNCHGQEEFFEKENFSFCKSGYTFISDNTNTYSLIRN